MTSLIPIVGILMVLASSTAYATVVNDTHSYWNGYDTNGVAIRSNDVIGIPNITSADILFKGTGIDVIDINLHLPKASDLAAWNYDNLIPGDIFIDKERDGYWDFVIHNPDDIVRRDTDYIKKMKKGNVATEWDIYSASLNYKDSSKWSATYNMATIFENSTSGWEWRKNHPVQAKDSVLDQIVGRAKVTWPGDISTTKYPYDIKASWDILGDALNLKDYEKMTISFTLNCGNDVIIEDVPIPNPEPGTLLLMGIGTVGMAYLKRHRASRSRA